ncbi:EAL domain-containing protein [Roseibium sp.]|uniref:EAL domain-containing protein n=1 Tax=Roseibium sp. TaxID=1936156 RepID=UPI003A9854B1
MTFGGQDLTLKRIVETVTFAFQPIVDYGTGVVYAHEALLRTIEPLGFNTPTDVLDAAFEKGFLPQLEPALLDIALASYNKILTAKGTKLFFNLDGRGLGQDTDPRMEMDAVTQRHGILASQICLELSERHHQTYDDITEHALRDLRRQGFLLALDDFGKGSSELRLLHDLGPDYVKIDRFFLTGIDMDARRKLFVTTVTNLAHVLGVRVIAEGVETEREYKACRDAGCDLIQGFFVAHPFAQKKDARLFYDHIRTPTVGSKRKEEERRIRAELLDLPTIGLDASMSDLLDIFMSDQEISAVPIVDSNREPRGLIHERDLKAYLYAGGSDEDDYKAALDLPIRNFVRSCPITDIDSNADMLLVTFASSLNSDGLIITENFRYAGFLSATSLLKIIHEKRLEEAKDQNPLSRMPGNGAITRFIADSANKRSGDRHYCYFDFDNFKPFNDTYGYRQGDRAIILFSELMQRHLSANGAFTGHVGGDDFFAGFVEGDQTDIAWQMLTLKRAFKTDVESFYDPAHREQGFIEATDRFGGLRQFPLLDCSISIVTAPDGFVTRADEVLEALAKLKREAKKSDDGLVVMTMGE